MAFESLFVGSFKASDISQDISPAADLYESGNIGGLIGIENDLSPSGKYMNAARGIVRNIGTVEPGNIMFIRTAPSPHAIELQSAVSLVVENKGAKAVGFLWHGGGPLLDALLKGSGGSVEEIVRYKEAYNGAIQQSNHWTVTLGFDDFELSNEAKKNLPAYAKAFDFGEYQKLLNICTSNDILRSYDMISAPTEWCADNVGVDFADYEERVLRAASIDGKDMLRRQTDFILSTFAKRVAEDGFKGMSGQYHLELGETQLDFSVWGRPVFRDAGPAGRDWNPVTNLPMVITNLPAGEAWVAPVEYSVKGHIETSVLYKSESGRILSLNAEVGGGVIVPNSVEDKVEEGSTLKRGNVFMEDFRYQYERTIGEIGIGGFNPELDFLVEIGKPTGDPIIDEKVFPLHLGVGTNISYGGRIKKGTHRDISINSGEKLQITKVALR